MKSKMASAEQVFVNNFEFSRARYSNLYPFPPEIGIPDTLDISIIRFDVTLNEKSNMAARP